MLNTIRRRLAEAKVQYRPTRQKPLLSEAHMEKRLAWATENVDRDWSNVLFSDEASFWAWVPIKRAWSAAGKRFLQRTVKHSIKIHVWGCFSQRGFGCLELLTENLNAQKMLQIYEHGLLRSSEKMFGANNKNWILEEDNDPKHRSHVCKFWKAENGITTLDWPSQSPDANPIENVWSVVKRKLAGRRAFTLKQLSRRIKEVWRSNGICRKTSREHAQKVPGHYPEQRRLDGLLGECVLVLYAHCCAKKEKWGFLRNFPSKRVPFLVEQTVRHPMLKMHELIPILVEVDTNFAH